jgi:hypothetical protein
MNAINAEAGSFDRRGDIAIEVTSTGHVPP